jgi:hypothetical protein
MRPIMRTRTVFRVIIVITSLAGTSACTKSEPPGHCNAVPLTGDWGTIPLSALKTGTVCSSDAKQVLLWVPGDGSATMEKAKADMEAAGYVEAVHQVLSARGQRSSFNLAYRKGADQVNLYVQPGDIGAEITISRGK